VLYLDLPLLEGPVRDPDREAFLVFLSTLLIFSSLSKRPLAEGLSLRRYATSRSHQTWHACH